MKNKWYSKTISEVFEAVKSGEQGLSSKEAELRLKESGKNKLPESKQDGVLTIFLRQFKSSLIYILLVACVIVFAMGETIDGIVILFVLIFNAIVGSVQEGKAQNTLLALKRYTDTKVVVLRDGREVIIADQDIVVGDVIILQEGEKISADARIIASNNLKVDESSLSGESVPVNKIAEQLGSDSLTLVEQKNIVFKGTSILTGNGKAIVTATGLKTAIGKIAKEIASIDSEIPLKKNIRYLSRVIIGVVMFLNVALLAEGLATGKGLREMFMTVVSLSVSIIPEGLPIVMTLILATGVWRMSKRNALVKRLQAVEALGQAEVIAVDKTGTITKNEMVVQKIFVNGKFFNVSGVGYEPKGEVTLEDKVVEPLNHPELIFAVKNVALCAGARVSYIEEEKRFLVSGDPTEAALSVLAQKIGFHGDILKTESPSLQDFPFDYRLRYSATLRKINGKKALVAVGASENILEISKKIRRDGKNYVISGKEKENLKNVFEKMASEGLRVVALAVDENFKESSIPQEISNLTFVGFFGMKDALREEVSDAVSRAVKAGVHIVMITGDHKITAMAIAKEAGIYKDGDEVITGTELDKMSNEDLSAVIKKVSIFARVSPEHKLRIIKAFKIAKMVIAMTGDGVNDAPSLVSADLGVAMGKIGTEVAKEASDIILLDDNFGSIISAIEEGRSIYKTIKKVILYLFSTGIGEALTIAGALFLGYPLPLLPVQIIWLNFVTDGFLDVSLAMEPREKNLLSERFKSSNRYLVDSSMIVRMILMSLTMMVGTLFIFKGIFQTDLVKAQTMSLAVLAVFQWFNAWNCKSEKKSIFELNPFTNKFLVASTGIVVALQLLAVYNPFMQKILHTTALGWNDLVLIVVVAFSIVIVEEIRKILYKLFVHIVAKTMQRFKFKKNKII
jgi:Ca2+-transporting ATPase